MVQDGVAWHIIRVCTGAITSTVASKLIRLRPSVEATSEYRRLVNLLGIRPKSDIASYTKN